MELLADLLNQQPLADTAAALDVALKVIVSLLGGLRGKAGRCFWMHCMHQTLEASWWSCSLSRARTSSRRRPKMIWPSSGDLPLSCPS